MITYISPMKIEKRCCILEPSYIFSDLSLSMHGHPPWDKYEIFRLLSIFDHIYADKRWFMSIVKTFAKNDIFLQKTFEKLFNSEIIVDIPFEKILLEYINKDIDYRNCLEFYNPRFGSSLEMGYLRRVHEIGRVVPKVRLLPLDSIFTHVSYAIENDFHIIFDRWLTDTSICITQKIGEEQTNFIKNRLKYSDTARTLLLRHIPSFQINEDNLDRYLNVVDSPAKSSLRNRIDRWCSAFGGYELKENERKAIFDDVVNYERQLMEIKNLFSELSFGSDVLMDFASLIFGAPVSALKSLMTKLLENKRIKEKNLDWLVYLQFLKVFQTRSEQPIKCKVCNLSVAEIENMPNEKVESYFNEMCTGHTILYLNLRKLTSTTGKELLMLIKEKESDPAWRLWAPLGH